jgi:PAS domain-containing protein
LEGLTAGADDYLNVPFRNEELLVKVARLAERHRVEKHYRRIVEDAADIIYTRDMDGYITSINTSGGAFFGKPAHETRPQHEECTGGNEKTVKYAGLEFYFMDGTTMKGKTYRVMSFDVSSPKYTVSGIKLGDTEGAVRTKFGKRFTVEKDAAKGEVYWNYEIGEKDGPGQTTVTLKNGKVTAISSSYTVC